MGEQSTGSPEDSIDDDSVQHVAPNAGKVIVNADPIQPNDSLPDELHFNL